MKKFIVCVKQVPDPQVAKIKIDPQTHTLLTEGVPSILNPFDQFALEECTRVREKVDGEITVVSMGPPQAKTTLMKCLALGADKAVLISDETFADSDTLATSYVLSLAIRKITHFDLVFCGQQSIDGETGQVGPQLAQHLGIAQVTYVERVEEIEDEKIIVKTQIDEGYRIVEVKLPALLASIPPSSFEPSIPPLRNILRAKEKEFIIWNRNHLGGEEQKYGLEGSPTQVMKVYSPPSRGKGVMITDKPQIACKKLVRILLKEGMIG